MEKTLTHNYHSENLRKHRRMHAPGVFFVTKCLLREKSNALLLADNSNGLQPADILIETILTAHENRRISLAAFVVMPDHWHALFGVGGNYLPDSRPASAELRRGKPGGRSHFGDEGSPTGACSYIEGECSRPGGRSHIGGGNAYTSLPQAMKSIVGWVSKGWNNIHKRRISWQSGYYETMIRSSRQFAYVCNYIETNPARAGLREDSSSWLYSSLNTKYKRALLRPWPWSFENDK
jgi:REP element-mobilizing transposase RayT